MTNNLSQPGSNNFAWQDIHDANFNIYLGKTLEYKELTNQLETQTELFTFLPEAETEKRLRVSQKIEELHAQILQFKQNVLQLAAEFDRIEINTDRLRRARVHFEQGEIAAARAVFDSEREQMQDENDALVKQKVRYEKDVVPQLKQSSEEYYLRALLERTAYNNPNWLEDTCNYFERSINVFATEDNVFQCALFLQNHHRFNQSESFYQKYLEEFVGGDQSKRAMTLNNLANLHRAKNELTKAEAEYVEALAIRRELAAVNPAAYLPDVAMTLINVAIYHVQSAPNRERSIRYALEALTILLPIVEDVPYTQNYLQSAMRVLQQGWDLSAEDIQQMLMEAVE